MRWFARASVAYRCRVSSSDPIVGAARRLAVLMTLFDTGLGIATIARPDMLRELFGDPPERGGRFVRRWGTTILGYAGVHALTALLPGPGTFGASASLRAVEAPADLLAAEGVHGPRRRLLQAASAFNAGATALFAVAAVRARRRGDR